MIPLPVYACVRRSGFVAAVLLLTFIADAMPVKFNIPAQPASEALIAFTKQATTEVLFSFDDLKRVQAQAVVGEFEPEESLRRLLRGTGYTATRTGGKFVVAARPERSSRETAPTPTAKPSTPLPTNGSSTPSVGSNQFGTIEGAVANATSAGFLKNARVIVAQTGKVTLTGEAGAFRLMLPPGSWTLRVEYAGLVAQQRTIDVRAGETRVEQFELSPAETDQAEVVKLDAFTVAAEYANAQMLALNEQKNAPNIKNVVASDEYADTSDGNIGNFLRNIAGVDIGYSGPVPRTISIRGFPASGTLLTIDGGEVASGTANGDGRHVEFDAVKMNNIDRVEVTKVPTPDLPANAQGGSVNVISRSGRDLRKPQFSYRLYGTANSRGFTHHGLDRRTVPAMGSVRPLRPAFDFSYIAPLSPNFAFTVGGGTSDPYNKAIYVLSTWDLVRDVQTSHQVRTLDRLIRKSNGAVGFDWKINREHLLKVNAQYISSRFYAGDNLQTTNFGAGATGGPDFVQGATTGVGTVNRTHYNLKWNERTTHTTLNYRFEGADWKIEAVGAYSGGVSKWRDIDHGFFQSVTSTLSNLVLRGEGLGSRPSTYPIPASLSAVDRSGVPVDVFDGGGYTAGTATSNQWLYTNIKKSAHVNARRDFHLGIPFTLKSGVAVYKQDRDIRRPTRSWTFRPTGTTAERLLGNYDVLDSQTSRFAPAFYPRKQLLWPSTAKFYELSQQHPEYFVSNPTTDYTSSVTGSKEFAETVSAGYVRFDLKLLNNRLWLVAGMRYERTQVAGAGPLSDPRAIYRQDATGDLLLDPAGRPIPITNDALARAMLQYRERGAVSDRSYDGFYPSLNSTYTINDNVLFRAAYARTIGRPNLAQIIPGVTIADPTVTEVNRTVNVVNAGLLPWQSDAFDLSLEAYLLKGGSGSVGVFRKDIRNFFGSTRTSATPELLAEYGLTDDYLDYDIVTTRNIGTARVDGFEFGYKQNVPWLPAWATGLQVFINGVVLKVSGPSTANFGAFSPRNVNWGFTWARSRFLLRVNWNQAAERRGTLVNPSATIPADTYDYRAKQTIVNANAELKLTRQFSLFATAGNLTDAPFTTLRFAPTTPDYARIRNPVTNGTDFTFGVKGQF